MLDLWERVDFDTIHRKRLVAMMFSTFTSMCDVYLTCTIRHAHINKLLECHGIGQKNTCSDRIVRHCLSLADKINMGNPFTWLHISAY